MSSIAIITARGGSKRIPKKNIKEFCGAPIMTYSIRAALESGLFDTVMVSTDSEEIRDVALAAGAEVPFLRSAETSNDFATTADVLREVLREYAARGRRFDTMCCLYPTAPFVTGEKLRAAADILRTSDARAVMPVVSFSFPPQRAQVIREGRLEYQYPEYRLTRSQDLEPIYHDVGQFYFYSVSEDLSFGLERTAPLIVSELEVQDIDNESDWELAEIKYRRLAERRGRA